MADRWGHEWRQRGGDAGKWLRADSASLAPDSSTSSLLVSAAGAAGFAIILAVVRRKRTEALDLAVTMKVQAVRHPLLERAMAGVSWFGFPPQSRVIPPLLIAGEWLSRYRLEALMQLLAWGTSGVSTVVKSFMARPRPVAGTDLRVVAADLGGSSFPSGHVLSYVGIYGWLSVVLGLVDPARLAAARHGRLSGVADHIGGPRQDLSGPPLGHGCHGLISDGFSYLAGLVTLYRQLKARRFLS